MTRRKNSQRASIVTLGRLEVALFISDSFGEQASEESGSWLVFHV